MVAQFTHESMRKILIYCLDNLFACLNLRQAINRHLFKITWEVKKSIRILIISHPSFFTFHSSGHAVQISSSLMQQWLLFPFLFFFLVYWNQLFNTFAIIPFTFSSSPSLLFISLLNTQLNDTKKDLKSLFKRNKIDCV